MSLVPYVHLDVSLDGLAAGAVVRLPADATHHLTRVLRLAPGAPVEIADGAGRHATGRFGSGEVTLTAPAEHTPPLLPPLVVAQALAKGRKLDEVVRQVTELGVDGFVALRTARSLVSLDAAKQAKVTERWRQVARSASEQSRRPTRPVIAGPVTVDELPTWCPGTGGGKTAPADPEPDRVLLVAHPGGRPLPTLLAQHQQPVAVTIAIGPEGGFDDAEVARFEAAGGIVVGLGPAVLRTEHAAAAAVAACAVLLGRWG